MAKSVTWPESSWAAFHLLKTKLKGNCPKNKQEVKLLIKAESLHLKHIMIVSFQGQCGGVQSQNAENCVNVAVNMDPTVHNKQS